MPFQRGHKSYVTKQSYFELGKQFSGGGNPFFGKKHSNEAKLKMVAAKKLKPIWSKGLKIKETPYYSKIFSKELIEQRAIKNTKVDCDARHNKKARRVMEKCIGRKLIKGEQVHHIDHNIRNNNIENLHLFDTIADHTNYHHFLRHCVYEMLNKPTKTNIKINRC